MAKAILNGVVLAESNQTEMVEGNHYFPPESVEQAYLTESNTQTMCPWKGMASYYSLAVNGQEVKDAAWYYPTPKSAAKKIKNHVAFYGSKVQIER